MTKSREFFFIKDCSLAIDSIISSYNFHIRPILSDKCFKCHGPDVSKQEAGLRLDYAKFAYAPLKEMKGAFAIVPGKPDESELFKRVSSTDSSYMMPLPESHLGALTPYQVKLFKKWIEQGAKYETHWAFISHKLIHHLLGWR